MKVHEKTPSAIGAGPPPASLPPASSKEGDPISGFPAHPHRAATRATSCPSSPAATPTRPAAARPATGAARPSWRPPRRPRRRWGPAKRPRTGRRGLWRLQRWSGCDRGMRAWARRLRVRRDGKGEGARGEGKKGVGMHASRYHTRPLARRESPLLFFPEAAAR